MIRDYERINAYLDELGQDIYAQPCDAGHYGWAKSFIDFIGANLPVENKTVLDMGCGVAFVAPLFLQYKMIYTGITICDEDIKLSKNPEYILRRDFHFTGMSDSSYDIIFSRHSLEHSPMPVLALMEWHRIAKEWLCLAVPNPTHFLWTGRNHYAVMNKEQLTFLLRRAGWIVFKEQEAVEEIRLICRKKPRRVPFYIGIDEQP